MDLFCDARPRQTDAAEPLVRLIVQCDGVTNNYDMQQR